MPFAFWVVAADRPRSIVELGIKSGVSYFAFCQAVEQLGLETRCHAIRTTNPRLAPGPSEQAVEAYNNGHYSSFSTLIKSSSRDALAKFGDRSIDLLHLKLNGDVNSARREFTAWLPKISTRGIVLLADLNSGTGQTSVQAAFKHLKQNYPTFEFLHGGGLGIVGVGRDLSPALRGLLSPSNDELKAQWRKAFARLGRGHLDRYLVETGSRRREADGPILDLEAAAPADELQQTAQVPFASEAHARDILEENERLKAALENAQSELKKLEGAQAKSELAAHGS